MNKINVHIIAFFVSLLFSCSGDKRNETDRIIQNLGEEIKNRVFHENIITRIGDFAYDGKAFLISASKDSIWLVDNYLNKVIVLDSTLSFLNDFINKGEGPNEHVGLKRVFFESNNEYSTFDFSQQLFRKFDSSDSLLLFNKFDGDNWVNDMVQLTVDTYLFAEASDDQYRFLVKNFVRDSVIREYQIVDLLDSFLSDRELQSIPYDKNLIFEGYFSAGSGNYVVYTCNKAGYAFVFDKTGGFVNAFQTIDKLPIPSFVKKEISPGYLVHEVSPDLRGNFSRAISNGKVYVLSNVLEPSYGGERPIDVYSASNGKYQYSFLVPNLEDGQGSNEITVFGGSLFLLYENSTVVKYSLHSDF
ncbi:hypothetical protein LZF95_18545 [Algoriphagus sp. AGSA1]|uniref:hypothetical protein n=1 Tax=Algoriphagus sp. AGSA1 TaxID=2907213 RepID=UPI001F39E29E|nr:hypothetical protein [Algoriphagus sp. AGSA1]MCE7056691.1 hypothetical protein [Algoriphagus sp. AGSA1]